MLFSWSEVRNAARGLLRAPIITVSAVLCLALGIGATTAIASAISRALLQPMPFHAPAELVAVHRVTPHSGPLGTWPHSAPNFVDLAHSTRQIEGLAALSAGGALISGTAGAIQASQYSVTGGLFPTLGVSAQLGRMLLPDDDRDDAPFVAVLGDQLWRRDFGADPAVVGSALTINGTPTIIVGIAPPDFRIPHGFQVISADVWLPMRFTPQQLSQRRTNYLQLLGRLAPGASVTSANAELRGIFANLVGAHPELSGEDVRVAPLRAEGVKAVRTPLLLLFGAVCMVLLISATNVAALLLARAVHRRREFAVRSALGASRWDTMRPMLIESGLITAGSMVLGIALGAAGVKTIGVLAAARIPHLQGLQIDWRVLGFALALAVVTAIGCGAVPSLRSARVDPQDALRGGRGGGTGREHHLTLRSLVVFEIALSLMLLIGAGLVLKSFAGLLTKDPGFDQQRLISMQITTSPARYPDATGMRGFVLPAIDAIEAVPGVERAAAISAVPFRSWGQNSNIRYEGQPGDNPTTLPIVEQRRVTPAFFEVTGQRLLSGRLLTDADDERPESPLVVVVNEALARRDFPGRDAVGQRFHRSDSTFATIVGVVSDIRNMGPYADPAPEMYWHYLQTSPGATSVSVLVRSGAGSRSGSSVVPAIRAAVSTVDPEAAVARVETMEELIARSLGQPRFYLMLLGTFAVIAIVLAVAGLYGVLSYVVERRSREIGIRTALGSSHGALVRKFAMEGFILVATGVVLGLAGGAGVTRLMTFMLYGTSPLDASTWMSAVAVLVVVAMAAATIPALRAARVDPLIAIRAE